MQMHVLLSGVGALSTHLCECVQMRVLLSGVEALNTHVSGLDARIASLGDHVMHLEAASNSAQGVLGKTLDTFSLPPRLSRTAQGSSSGALGSSARKPSMRTTASGSMAGGLTSSLKKPSPEAGPSMQRGGATHSAHQYRHLEEDVHAVIYQHPPRQPPIRRPKTSCAGE